MISATLPRSVTVIENEWIPLPHGGRLAARIWLPDGAEQTPVPAILEYLPYRKRDFTRIRDDPMHGYFAGHGYACLRVDIRGSGDSDGILTDEYSPQEQEDALEVIDWIAAQPWCDGAVGMMGISWGGFNALQIAALNPAPLKAVITLCSTDDRYADDAHYMGGCLLNENLQWGSVLFTINAYPPDPEIVGHRWRQMWLERLEQATLFPATWLRHQRRDSYWKHGSVCEDFAGIRCPVYAIGGWADGYSNAVPRLVESLKVPRKGLIGPWAHAFPHNATPGPPIGFLQEALRWWDHWLKGADTGIMDEPAYRVWMQESVLPRPYYEARPGRWVAEPEWPSKQIDTRSLAINDGTLDTKAVPGRPIRFLSPQTTGAGGGDWCAFGVEGEMPIDQRRDDGTSIVFDGQPLDESLEILGAPVVELDLSVDRASAFMAVRLNDVAPGGASTRVTFGILNLTHLQGHEHPRPFEPGRRTRVSVELNHIAHSFPSGHSIRLSVSTAYWPMVWPSPEPVTLTLYPGSGLLHLPVRTPRSGDEALRPFALPEQAEPVQLRRLRPGQVSRTFERDMTSNDTVYTIVDDGAEFDGASRARIEEIDLELGHWMRRCYRISERDPTTACSEIEQRTLFQRGAWLVRLETRCALSADRENFRLEASLKAYEGETVVFERRWDERICRDHV